jgi:hypothetical protein
VIVLSKLRLAGKIIGVFGLLILGFGILFIVSVIIQPGGGLMALATAVFGVFLTFIGFIIGVVGLVLWLIGRRKVKPV